MKESFSRVHVHELPSSEEEVPVAANDNEEFALQPRAANDNVVGPINIASPEINAEAAHRLLETRSRLGLTREASATAGDTEEESVIPEEIPQLKPEDAQEIVRQISPETIAAQSNVESPSENSEARAAQSAGGASDDSGEGGGGRGGSHGGEMSAPTEGEKDAIGKTSGGFWKAIKFGLLAPVLVFGALLSLGLNVVKYLTNKIFNFAGMSGGGGGAKPSSGGSSKPSGGGHH